MGTWGSLGALGGSFGGPWGALGRHWRCLEGPREALGGPMVCSGCLPGSLSLGVLAWPLWRHWGAYEHIEKPYGFCFEHLEVLGRALGILLGPWGLLWELWGALGGPLGVSEEPLGVRGGSLSDPWGPIRGNVKNKKRFCYHFRGVRTFPETNDWLCWGGGRGKGRESPSRERKEGL